MNHISTALGLPLKPECRLLSRLLSGGLSLVGGRPVGRLSLVGGRLSVGGLLVAGCDLAACGCRPKNPNFHFDADNSAL